MNKILILFAHPAIQKSKVNSQMAALVKGIPGVKFRDLYEEYPDFDIDVAKEQKLLLENDVVIFQHPFYWYSTPAILKEWCDLVLEHGFAYGEKGTKLEGKIWINALTTGGPETAYHAQGYNRFTIRQFLAPLDQTAHLCGMHFLAPFVIHGALGLKTKAEVAGVAQEYLKLIEFLRDYHGDWTPLTHGERFQKLILKDVVDEH
jgi:glutathione-regulated potassium-efflux system ancillary protein KefG